MKDEEYKAILESLFPVGKERWIKVLYKDFDWCVKNLRITNTDKPSNIPGFEVTALGVRDEFVPQIAAMLDLKADVVEFLYDKVPEQILNHVNELFRTHMSDLKSHTITEVPK